MTPWVRRLLLANVFIFFLQNVAPGITDAFVFVPRWIFLRPWTIVTYMFLHAGFSHILFNMMAVRQLAPAVADMYGTARMIIIYICAGIVGFLLSSVAGAYLPPLLFLRGSGFTVGASASISALVVRGRGTPNVDMMPSPAKRSISVPP